MKIGDKYLFSVNEFDGHTEAEATVTEIFEDHAILKTDDGMTLWYDGDTAHLFIQL